MGETSGASRRLASLAMFVGALALVAGCVYPKPPPGQPTPSLTLARSGPLGGQVVVSATPANFTPTSVLFHVDTLFSPPVATDTVAPFEATIDTTALAPGVHNIWAVGRHPSFSVYQYVAFTVAPSRPNIVTLLLDDLDEVTTPYWDAMPQTRALLADQGLVFDNAFVTDPTCCPSRATILTGDYPHNTGVWDNTPPDGGYSAFAANRQSDTLATRLKAAGYTTAHLGKYLNGYTSAAVPPGWDEWWAFTSSPYFGVSYKANHNGVIETYGYDEDDYSTDVISQLAVDFVADAEATDAQPFFAYITPTAPHYPILPPIRHTPNPFGGVAPEPRPNRNEGDVSDKPTWLRDGYPVLTPGELDWHAAQYASALGSLLAVDDLMARLVQELQARGELTNTVFVFTSDNGFQLDAHRLSQKMAPYEESIRVPLVLAGPGIRVGTEDRMVTNNDLAPTLLELAGAGPQADMDGRSLVPLLLGGSPEWRDDFLVEYRGTNAGPGKLDTYADVLAAIATYGTLTEVPTYRAVRSDEYLYVEWYSGSPHEYELYDLEADPYQLDNLVATPEGAQAHAAVTAALQARLAELAACSAASCRE